MIHQPALAPSAPLTGATDSPRVSPVEAGRVGSWPRGSQHYAARLTDADVIEIRRRAAAGEKLKAIASDYPQVSKVSVHYAIKRRSWKHLPAEAA